jgi:hypothetical protein
MSEPNPSITFDINSLRLPDNFITVNSGIKLPIKLSFGKLSKHRFCRTHSGVEYQFSALLVDDKEGREVYLALPHLAPYLGSMAKSVILRLVVDNVRTPKIIAQPILDALTKSTLWSVSMVEAIRLSETQWIRIESNMDAQQYEIIQAAANLGEPEWPKQTMAEIVQEVFSGRIIDSVDHPLILQLQGRV